MRRVVPAVAIALLLTLPARAQAQDALYTVFGSYLESLRAQTGIPGLAAMIVGPRDVAWRAAYGQQDVDKAVSARTDTPFHADGLTQLFTTAIVLRCVEEGRLSLDDRIGRFAPDSADPNATVGQLLTHTSGAVDNPAFSYNPARLDPLAFAMSACSGESSREMLASLLDRLGMNTSVPGPDAIHMVPPYEGVTAAEVERYAAILGKLATPYTVDAAGHASASQYTVTTIKPASGLVSTVEDLAKFDLALKSGVLLKPDTLAAAWKPPVNKLGQTLPHGTGWFVQTYNGKQVVWQFGIGHNASSSLIVTIPSQGLTLILLANSDGLAKAFPLTAGDVTVSPFGRLFLATFVR